MAYYITYAKTEGDHAQIVTIAENPFSGIEKYQPGGIWLERLKKAPEKPGLMAVYYVRFLPDDEYETYYDYVAIPEPEETQLAKLQRQLDTLTAKASALSSGQEIQEDVITEIVMHVYK